MKKLFFLLLCVNSLLSFSQTDKISKKYDEFNKTTKYSIDGIKIAKNKNTKLKCDLSKRCDEGLTLCVYSLYFYTEKPIGCVSSSSYITFLFEDSKTKTLEYKGSIDCGTYAIYFMLTEEEFKEITEQKISKIRIHTDSDFDYEISNEDEIKLKEIMKNILAIK